jgi:hypothetical protein
MADSRKSLEDLSKCIGIKAFFNRKAIDLFFVRGIAKDDADLQTLIARQVLLGLLESQVILLGSFNRSGCKKELNPATLLSLSL